MAGLAPIDVNSRPVDFEFITNNTILLHESPVSSDDNNLFNSPNQVPVSRDRFFNRISEETRCGSTKRRDIKCKLNGVRKAKKRRCYDAIVICLT